MKHTIINAVLFVYIILFCLCTLNLIKDLGTVQPNVYAIAKGK